MFLKTKPSEPNPIKTLVFVREGQGRGFNTLVYILHDHYDTIIWTVLSFKDCYLFSGSASVSLTATCNVGIQQVKHSPLLHLSAGEASSVFDLDINLAPMSHAIMLTR